MSMSSVVGVLKLELRSTMKDFHFGHGRCEDSRARKRCKHNRKEVINMLNPAKILETMKAGGNLGTNSQSSLSQPFMQGVSNIQMSGPDAAKSVMSNVTKSCDDMFGNMKGILMGCSRM